jgi:hypothetical protein
MSNCGFLFETITKKKNGERGAREMKTDDSEDAFCFG